MEVISPYRANLNKMRQENLGLAVKNCTKLLFEQGNLRPSISQICSMSNTLPRTTLSRYFASSSTPAVEHIIRLTLDQKGDQLVKEWLDYIFKDGIHAVDRLHNMPRNAFDYGFEHKYNPLWVIIQLSNLYPGPVKAEADRIIRWAGHKFAEQLKELDGKSIAPDAIEPLGLALMSSVITLSVLSDQSTDPLLFRYGLDSLNTLLGLAIKTQYLEARF